MTYSNTIKQSGSIDSSEGLPIRYDLYLPDYRRDARFPVILFLHGFKGFKDWGPFPDACDELARAGFGVVALNFSLNGVGESLTEFDEPDLFARETLSQDLDDVGRVIDALNSGTIDTDKADLLTDSVGILGHSRGGHTAVAAAAEYTEINALVTWSAAADYLDRWSEQMKQDWQEKGYTEILNSRTGQVMRIDRVVYEDALEHADRVIALKRVEELYIPSLFVHAKEDESVPPADSEQLYRNCPADEKKLKLVSGTGHTFGGAHPFEEDEFPDRFADVLSETVRWFEDHLK